MAYYQTPATPSEAVLIHRNNELFQENYQRSQNEQTLYAEWRKAELEKSAVIANFNQLQNQLTILQAKYTELEKKLSPPPQKEEEDTIEYQTDEEELARETEWIRKTYRNNKKRKMDTSITPPQKNQTVSNNQHKQAKKPPVPPPIVVDGINNFNALHEKLNRMKTGHQIKIISNDNIKINVPDEEGYRKVSKMLGDNGYSWYTYENKQKRPVRVIANKLHHECDPIAIVDDLRKRGYKAIEAAKKLKFKTKQPLNMFMLSFRHDEDINKIYSITDILGIRVEIKPIKKSKLVPQCKRCQGYQHTQGFCSKEPRCVKCTGKHLTKDCTKPENVEPKCIHCGGNHPANYRGCIVAKQIQKNRANNMKKPSLPRQPVRQVQQVRTDDSAVQSGNNRNQDQKSENRPYYYNQAVAGPSNPSKNNDTMQIKASTDPTLQLILDQLKKQEQMFQKFDERLTRLEHSAKGAIPKQRNG